MATQISTVMEPPSSFVVTPPPGFTPIIGRLVAQLQYVRWSMLRAVDGLTVADLDHLHDSDSNSIGSLLAHVAAVEVTHQRLTFGAVAVDDALGEHLAAAEALGERARSTVHSHPLSYYVEVLDHVRAFTLVHLAQHDDPWLETPAPFDLVGGRPANNHFKWFHVAEDELNHRGQIRWLRRRLPVAP